VRGGANQPLVGSYNRRLVLDAIRSTGTASRVELIEITGLTGPAIGGIVRRLIADGFVMEVGQAASTGGKPRTLLQVRPDAAAAVGVQLDAEATTYVVTDLTGSVVASATGKGVGSQEPAAAVDQITHDVHELLRKCGVPRVAGVGVAAPGPLDHETGVVHDPPNFRRWREVPLRDLLTDRLALPVLVDNDATAAVVGERWVGAAGQVKNVACVYMGAGIGAGLVLDGHVQRGATSNAGELGHISLDVEGPRCYCGNRGCVELYSAPRAVVTAARDAGLLPSRSRGVTADYARLCKAAVTGEPGAAGLLEHASRHLAEAVVTLVNLVDPQLVVLSGRGFAISGELHRMAIEQALSRHALARRSQHVDVRLSALAEKAGAIGAASLVLDARFSPRMSELGVATRAS
jgi:predicted NBD/HSP70 family sugar kinase